MANNVTRYDPMRELMRFDPFRSLDDIVRDFPLASALRGLDVDRRLRVDVTDSEHDYVVKADIPGARKEDIRVSVDGNVVSISATVQNEQQQTSGGTIYSERYTGAQFRSFSLPQEVDDTRTAAKYEDGVLHLTLPKKPGTARKQIAIQ
ncbi:Hsp20/alpha crystallin family protein [Telluria beijingensis]|uniref:Hsp20/alpha crystallin family protein n=1 Tax=Telluria beijingensis TaxID=3068633 RepID=UPI002795F2F0|nr:Hsp20/alpha crystallin family protein [Massilia sp. REN29]